MHHHQPIYSGTLNHPHQGRPRKSATYQASENDSALGLEPGRLYRAEHTPCLGLTIPTLAGLAVLTRDAQEIAYVLD